MEISGDMIKAVRELFIVRDDCYPKQMKGINEYNVIKENFSDEIIRKHLEGTITIGSFQIDPKTNKVKWICFDFDGELDVELEKAKSLWQRLRNNGYNPVLEFSGRRGYHVWLFIEPTDAATAKLFATQITEGIEVSEIFPKQEKIEETGFGGQVKIPLGIHRVSYKRSYFFDKNFSQCSIESSKEVILNLQKRERDSIQFSNLTKFT